MIPSELTTWHSLEEALDDEAEEMTAAGERASARQQACDGLGGTFKAR